MAIEQASQHRSDLKAAEIQLRAAEIALSAAHAERLLCAKVNGDYGVLGPNPASTHGVFAVTGAVNFPIWQAGGFAALSNKPKQRFISAKPN